MYAKPGQYEVSTGHLLPSWCTLIKDSANFERDLASTIDTLGRGGRRVNALSLEDVVAMEGKGIFSGGSRQWKALQHVLLRFLHSLGVVRHYPAVIGYRTNPYLRWSELVDAVMTNYVRWPASDSLGGENLNIEGLRSAFATIIREMAFYGNLRPVISQRLRLKLGDVAFKIATGQAIDQAERSFYVNYSHDSAACIDHSEEFMISAASASGLVPAIAQSGDPLVMETWAQLRAATEPGPFLRFVTLKSNVNLENLVFWYGPSQTSLTYGMGYSIRFGRDFHEPRIADAFVLPWTANDQLTAAREQVVSFRSNDTTASLRAPILSVVDGAIPPEPTWDLPDVNIRVSLESGKIRATEYSYYSSWRERVVTTDQGATPSTLLLDLALSKETLGEGQHTGHSFSDWGLIDMEASAPYLGSHAPAAVSWDERIVIPKANGGVEAKTVPVGPLYEKLGKTLFPPSFREYVKVPKSWLHVVDTEAENYIAARLGLTKEQREQAERSIRVSHNFFRLSRLLKPHQLPVNEGQMQVICQALLGS